MNSQLIALLACAGIFVASLVGMWLRKVLPDQHLNAATKECVQLGMGLVATMTALLLGLLIASAKGTYDTQRNGVIEIAAKVGFLDRALATYGPETNNSRAILRHAVEMTIQRMWPDKSSTNTEVTTSVAEARTLYDSIQQLAPRDELQRSLKAEALSDSVELSKTLWLLSAQKQVTIVVPLLVILILWLAVIFLSFGLLAPSNKTVIVTMLIVALSVSSAIFLILELDQPFQGLIRISSEPMRNVLNNLGR
ncbi:MAG TPA: hypothetical protein VN843_13595 [Anaerolineales bacterium]|nr:hypothetical protein [Anaerolineales bacterium]